MQDPYYDTDPYEAVFSKMDVIGNQARGGSDNPDYLRIVAAAQQPHRKGTPCPRCGRVGSSCKIAYCVYG